eukprot:CAMPEP_0168315876 /NCGR_PEP_ID=MMETSP0210-20121227/13127_1 /TAXON_ID=40633 /ORGANISM="Condylostoma magnum, Strain COL2" /LENGTH=108 /DNA_ID=CAMNT_0008292367 /DNA_START=1557 /DNA_END=1883 /DNA_ORIENTATION=-
MINVNCNATVLSIIDIHGVLTFYDTTQGADKNITGTHLEIERKDVWDMKWSYDNPDMIAIKEKARMFVLTRFEPEEPEVSTTYLCDFKDLEIKAVELDDIMKQPDNPG